MDADLAEQRNLLTHFKDRLQKLEGGEKTARAIAAIAEYKVKIATKELLIANIEKGRNKSAVISAPPPPTVAAIQKSAASQSVLASPSTSSNAIVTNKKTGKGVSNKTVDELRAEVLQVQDVINMFRGNPNQSDPGTIKTISELEGKLKSLNAEIKSRSAQQGSSSSSRTAAKPAPVMQELVIPIVPAQVQRTSASKVNVGFKRHAKKKKTENVIDALAGRTITRLARRGGVRRTSDNMKDELRGYLVEFLKKVLESSISVTDVRRAKTVTAKDIVFGLKRATGKNLYGF